EYLVFGTTYNGEMQYDSYFAPESNPARVAFVRDLRKEDHTLSRELIPLLARPLDSKDHYDAGEAPAAPPPTVARDQAAEHACHATTETLLARLEAELPANKPFFWLALVLSHQDGRRAAPRLRERLEADHEKEGSPDPILLAAYLACDPAGG